jgi:2-hydroxychromene-2-carboxylate isomerase
LVRLDFYFDFSCPFAYLASTRIEALAARHDADLRWQPMLLGGVFRAVDMVDFPAALMPPAKARHNGLDMLRWADVFAVPLRIPAGHPMRTVRALRALLATPESAWPPLVHALFAAYWVRGEDMTQPATIERALAAAGVDDATVRRALAANDDPKRKDELRRRTDEAIARGIFGAPTMFVGEGEAALMFWGQDRLDMVERALAGWRPELPATRPS